MTEIGIPATGIQVQHSHEDVKSASQIFRLKLSHKDAEDLIKHTKDENHSHIRLGKKLEVHFGNRHLALLLSKDKCPQEVFSRSLDDATPTYFAGKLSHALEVQQAKEATTATEEAVEKLKNSLKRANEDRNSPDPTSLSNKLLKSQHRPSPFPGGFLSSRPSSPFLSAAYSPRTGPTSAPFPSGPSKQERIKFDAIKIPAIHLLAVDPYEPAKLAGILRVKRSELDPVLLKIAQEGKGGKKELRDRSFRELDVWTFPYRSQNERQCAIDRAISAYDRQRIDKTDNLWQMLLAKEDRNKGIHLSRLNFDKPLMPGNITPRVPERSTDGGSTEGKSMNSTISEQSTKKGKTAVSKPSEPPAKSRVAAGKVVKPLKDSGKPTVSTKAASKSKETKQDVKYKSSERIVDSDEEANATSHAVAPSSLQHNASKLSKPSHPDNHTISKPPVHKSQLSTSSSGRSDTDRGRPAASTMVKTRGGKDTAKAPNPAKSLELPPASSRPTSRPRHGSSPTKPSPLGSSPPTNSRDVDSTSNSSKGTSLSSAPSSPPSTSNSSQLRKQLYSPAREEKKLEKVTNGVKRKAGNHQDAPPAKKQQNVSSKNDTDRFNSLPKPLADEGSRVPVSKRSSPDSDASLSGKAITKEDLHREAREFHRCYARYKDLHEKLNKMNSNERADKEVDTVWKMHVKLKEMKDRIWKEWAKLERVDRR